MKNFEGKIAFITGGASGAGLGQAKVFSKAGMKVVIVDVRQDALDAAVPEILAYSGAPASDVYAINVDLTDRAQLTAAADKTEEIFGGPPHLLIQTAGVNSFGPAEASTFEDFDWVIGVNLLAVISGLVIFVPRMIKAYGNKEEAHVVTTSSMGSWGGGAGTVAYSASKAAVNNLMDSYWQALRPYGFGATALCPSCINSNIFETEKHRPEHLKKSGYNWTDDVEAVMKEHCESGMDPVVLAEWLKKGIEDEIVFCLPFANSYELIARTQERILNLSSPGGIAKEDAYNAWLAKTNTMPPGMDAYVLREKGGQVGFGKAKDEVEWVADEKKFKA
jgi:NAD(P)-dependent dehydrogenase (short-subunit alcohol dehydrogenase family)